MKFWRLITFRISIVVVFLGCSQGLVIVDPYWDLIARTQGVKPKHLAWKHGLSYHVLPEGEIDQIIAFARELVDFQKKDVPKIIMSPLLEGYAKELMIQGRHVGVFTMQGNIDEGLTLNNAVYRVTLSRYQILKKLAEKGCVEDKRFMIVYKNVDDFKIFLDIFGDNYRQLVPVYITEGLEVQRIVDEVQLTLGISEVDNIFLLAEPYNLRIWKRLAEYQHLFDNVYVGGAFIKEEGIVIFSDNIEGQMEVLISGINKEVPVESFVWNKSLKKFKIENF